MNGKEITKTLDLMLKLFLENILPEKEEAIVKFIEAKENLHILLAKEVIFCEDVQSCIQKFAEKIIYESKIKLNRAATERLGRLLTLELDFRQGNIDSTDYEKSIKKVRIDE